MKSQLNRLVGAFFFVVLLIALLAGYFFGTPPKARAASGTISDHLQYGYGGGDCFADRATGDLYNPVDVICQPVQPSRSFLNLEVGTGKTPTATTVVNTPIVATSTPTDPTFEPTQPPTLVATEQPTEVTPKPTEVSVTRTPKPPVVVTPRPTKDNPTPEPRPTKTEKPCRNPNDGKDNDPDDCNAGGGNDNR